MKQSHDYIITPLVADHRTQWKLPAHTSISHFYSVLIQRLFEEEFQLREMRTRVMNAFRFVRGKNEVV